VGDDATDSSAAVELGIEIARLAHARATLLRIGTDESVLRERVERDRERFSRSLPGLEVTWSTQTIGRAVSESSARRHFDLIVVGTSGRDPAGEAGRLLESIDAHLLLVPGPRPVPDRALLCVALGEPGKEDVLFAGRFLRHLGGRATIFTVLPEGAGTEDRERAERFLHAGVRTLELLGVRSESVVESGQASQAIVDAIARGRHDLVVLGAPLPATEGRRNLDGIVATVLSGAPELPVLIVKPRSDDRERQVVETRR
jgi:sulfate transport system ATP-binding protein